MDELSVGLLQWSDDMVKDLRRIFPYCTIRSTVVCPGMSSSEAEVEITALIELLDKRVLAYTVYVSAEAIKAVKRRILLERVARLIYGRLSSQLRVERSSDIVTEVKEGDAE